MKHLQQAYLGVTAARSLTIVDFATSAVRAETPLPIFSSLQPLGAQGPSNNISILQLPDELLVTIIELVAKNHRSGFLDECEECSYGYKVRLWNYHYLKALSRVCRRFAQIAQPLLFRTICFEKPIETVPPGRQVQKLHRTLKESPQFLHCCRSLHIHIPDREKEGPLHKHIVASDFARSLTRLRCLSIHGGFHNASTWPLIRRFNANCKDIEHLQLSEEDFGIHLEPIFKWLDFPKLKTLSICGLSDWKYHRVEREVNLEPKKHRTAPFTKIILTHYEDRIGAIPQIILWPAVLSHFRCSNIYANSRLLDYSMFEPWLLIHRETLKHVELGYLSIYGSRRVFNATLFPNLEFLKLSRWQGQGQEPLQWNAEDANILGPKLETFCWDFDYCEAHSTDWSTFRESESSWIRELANTAVSRKAALRTIQIQLPPHYWNTDEGIKYPWKSIDYLTDDVLRSKGINLVYNEPPSQMQTGGKEGITANEWFESVQFRGRERRTVEDQATESSEEAEYEGWYQGEDIRKYLVSTSSS